MRPQIWDCFSTREIAYQERVSRCSFFSRTTWKSENCSFCVQPVFVSFGSDNIDNKQSHVSIWGCFHNRIIFLVITLGGHLGSIIFYQIVLNFFAVLCTTCSSAVLHRRSICISAVYCQYIGNISEINMNISFKNISAIYPDWLHSFGTRSAVKILKVFTTTTDPQCNGWTMMDDGG